LPGAFEDLIKEECIKALFNDKERRTAYHSTQLDPTGVILPSRSNSSSMIMWTAPAESIEWLDRVVVFIDAKHLFSLLLYGFMISVGLPDHEILNDFFARVAAT
jgi:hypothetical protein